MKKDKEGTKRKLLDAIDQIVKHEGFEGLGVNKVSRIAGVSKILIYRYFESFNRMVKTYIDEKDFWKNYKPEQDPPAENAISIASQVNKLLHEQFPCFYNHCEMRALIITGLLNDNVVLKNISSTSNLENNELYFPDWIGNINRTTVYYNVVSSLLEAGTNQLVLNYQSSLYRNDLSTVKPQDELFSTIGQIVTYSFG